MSVLVTGGMGFLGLHTDRRFLDAGEDVIATQHTARREPDFLKEHIGKRLRIEQVDLTDAGQVMDLVGRTKPDGIIHLAAPPPRGQEPAEEYALNIGGLINVLEAARTYEVRRVVVASSQTVYSPFEHGPFREDWPLPVESTLGIESAKKAMEILSLNYAERTGLDVIIARVGGIYGPMYQTLNHPIARMCYAAAHGEPADFPRGAPFADDGRGYCYVKDCAAGVQLLQSAPSLNHRIYNVSGGVGSATTNGVIADAIRAVVPDAQIELQPGSGLERVPDAYMDISRSNEELGYAPAYDIERGVTEYIAWLQTNPR